MNYLRKLLLTVLAVLLTVQSTRADFSDEDRERARQRDRDGEIRYERWQQDQQNYGRRYASDHFAAIAYSPSTRTYGYSFDYGTLTDARRAALARCKGPQAENVVWARNGYCALAAGTGSTYGWGHGSTDAIARANALTDCRKHSTEARVLVCVFSGR
jgi:hypothetical protein